MLSTSHLYQPHCLHMIWHVHKQNPQRGLWGWLEMVFCVPSPGVLWFPSWGEWWGVGRVPVNCGTFALRQMIYSWPCLTNGSWMDGHLLAWSSQPHEISDAKLCTDMALGDEIVSGEARGTLLGLQSWCAVWPHSYGPWSPQQQQLSFPLFTSLVCVVMWASLTVFFFYLPY